MGSASNLATKVIGPDAARSGTASQTTMYAYSTLTAVDKLGFQQVTVTDPEGEATVGTAPRPVDS